MQKIQTPDQARAEAIQIATIQTQYRNILDRLERRLRSALDLNDLRLVAMLRAEKETIEKKLLPIPHRVTATSIPWNPENSGSLSSIEFVIPAKKIESVAIDNTTIIK